VAGCVLVLGALFAALHSPWFLNRLANAFGYEVSAQTISFSPSLSGSISGLSIKKLRGNGLTLLASNVTTRNSLDMVLSGEVDSLVLQNPKLTYRIGKENSGGLDLSFLKKLPNIRLLDVRNAEALFSVEGGQQQMTLTNMNLTIKNYSSKTGGSITFQTNFTVATGGQTPIAASGKLTGNFQLTGVYPKPYGKGTVEWVVESGKYTSDNRTVSLSGLRLVVDMVYDQRTETFAITTLRGESKNFGAIQGTAKAVLRGEMPWNVNLSVASIDFAQAFAVMKPFLPEEYRTWTMQGAGAIESQLEGTYADERLSLTGNVTFSFSQGGFSSPDSAKAAQGVSGRIILKLKYAAPEQKLAFDIRSEQRDGEYLWGTYYADLAGHKASLAADGSYAWGIHRHFVLNGLLDIFQSGEYSFSADGAENDWTIRFTATDVSHSRIVEVLLKDYLKGLSPGLASLSVSGTSALETLIRREGDATQVSGAYRMTGTTLNVPDMQLAIREIAADLPFDLEYSSSGKRAPPPPAPGFIRFQTVQRRRLSIDNLRIPLLVAHNMLEVPEPVTVPFFGGEIHLYDVQVDDLLSPTRYRFGVKIDGVDLGRMTRRLTGTEFAGIINADFGVMRYEHNRIASEGKAVIRVFGGEIEATNLFAENITSTSRRIGGDITFKDINLEELTRKIAIGKMSGIIRGSLSDFVMEYGQPASFVLEIESTKARGVQQSISLDAIESIAILGTGAGSALNRGITQFFKEYPYSKIGIRCALKNDQFSVRGTIHEDGKEYLVRRGFLRGVDVVNQNPENIISFKDMQERIARIHRSPQAGAGGIEIK
jgi:hypothetical protein